MPVADDLGALLAAHPNALSFTVVLGLWKAAGGNAGARGGRTVSVGGGAYVALTEEVRIMTVSAADIQDAAFNGIEANMLYEPDSGEGEILLGWLWNHEDSAENMSSWASQLEFISIMDAHEDFFAGLNDFLNQPFGSYVRLVSHPYVQLWPRKDTGAGKWVLECPGQAWAVAGARAPDCLPNALLTSFMHTAFRAAYVRSPGDSTRGTKTVAPQSAATIRAAAGVPAGTALRFSDVRHWLEFHGLGVVVVDISGHVRIRWLDWVLPQREKGTLAGPYVAYLLAHNGHVWTLDSDMPMVRHIPDNSYASTTAVDATRTGAVVLPPTSALAAAREDTSRTGVIRAWEDLKDVWATVVALAAASQDPLHESGEPRPPREEVALTYSFAIPTGPAGGVVDDEEPDGPKLFTYVTLFELWRVFWNEYALETTPHWHAGELVRLHLFLSCPLPARTAKAYRVLRVGISFVAGDVVTQPGEREFSEVRDEFMKATAMLQWTPYKAPPSLSTFSGSMRTVVGAPGMWGKGLLRRCDVSAAGGGPERVFSVDAIRAFTSALAFHCGRVPVFTRSDCFVAASPATDPTTVVWDPHTLYIITIPEEAWPDPVTAKLAWWQMYLLCDREYTYIWGDVAAAAAEAWGLDLRAFIWGWCKPATTAMVDWIGAIERMYEDPATRSARKLVVNAMIGWMGRSKSVRERAYFSTERAEALQIAAWHREVAGTSAATYNLTGLMGGHLTVTRSDASYFRDGWVVQMRVHDWTRFALARAITELAEWMGPGRFDATFAGVCADSLLFRELPVGDGEAPGWYHDAEAASQMGTVELGHLGGWRVAVHPDGSPKRSYPPRRVAAVLRHGDGDPTTGKFASTHVAPHVRWEEVGATEQVGGARQFAAASAPMDVDDDADADSELGGCAEPAAEPTWEERPFAQTLPRTTAQAMLPAPAGTAPMQLPGNVALSGVAGGGKTFLSMKGLEQKRGAAVIVCPTHRRRLALQKAYSWWDPTLGKMVSHRTTTSASLVWSARRAQGEITGWRPHAKGAARTGKPYRPGDKFKPRVASVPFEFTPGLVIVVEELAMLPNADILEILAMADDHPECKWVFNYDVWQNSLEGANALDNEAVMAPSRAATFDRFAVRREDWLTARVSGRCSWLVRAWTPWRLTSEADRALYLHLREAWRACEAACVAAETVMTTPIYLPDPRDAVLAAKADPAHPEWASAFVLVPSVDALIDAGVTLYITHNNIEAFYFNDRLTGGAGANAVGMTVVCRCARSAMMHLQQVNHQTYKVLAFEDGAPGRHGTYTMETDVDRFGNPLPDGAKQRVTRSQLYYRPVHAVTSHMAQGEEYDEPYGVDGNVAWMADPALAVRNVGKVPYFHTALSRAKRFSDVHIVTGPSVLGPLHRYLMDTLRAFREGLGPADAEDRHAPSAGQAIALLKETNGCCTSCAGRLSMRFGDAAQVGRRPVFARCVPGTALVTGSSFSFTVMHAACAATVDAPSMKWQSDFMWMPAAAAAEGLAPVDPAWGAAEDVVVAEPPEGEVAGSDGDDDAPPEFLSFADGWYTTPGDALEYVADSSTLSGVRSRPSRLAGY